MLAQAISIDYIMPDLLAFGVITFEDKYVMETMPTSAKRTTYFLDKVLIPSLKVGFMDIYTRFLQVLVESDDAVMNKIAKRLGMLMCKCL